MKDSPRTKRGAVFLVLRTSPVDVSRADDDRDRQRLLGVCGEVSPPRPHEPLTPIEKENLDVCVFGPCAVELIHIVGGDIRRSEERGVLLVIPANDSFPRSVVEDLQEERVVPPGERTPFRIERIDRRLAAGPRHGPAFDALEF